MIDPIELALKNARSRLRTAERKTSPEDVARQCVLIREAASDLANALAEMHTLVRQVEQRVEQID
jgi:hypothetical protein